MDMTATHLKIKGVMTYEARKEENIPQMDQVSKDTPRRVL